MPWKDPEGSFVNLGLDRGSLVKRAKWWGFHRRAFKIADNCFLE